MSRNSQTSSNGIMNSRIPLEAKKFALEGINSVAQAFSTHLSGSAESAGLRPTPGGSVDSSKGDHSACSKRCAGQLQRIDDAYQRIFTTYDPLSHTFKIGCKPDRDKLNDLCEAWTEAQRIELEQQYLSQGCRPECPYRWPLVTIWKSWARGDASAPSLDTLERAKSWADGDTVKRYNEIEYYVDQILPQEDDRS
ncbi:hypothetical protein I302_104897 [Kwoniella bestiolae CBS 10118]|uniref:Uncharacterized protein n=1 Tax=Kwoniella bestiolae CBS 10118 TaxID=1296100 RepID=A0A1B9FRH2_9TREE|nr:hypothetical protein I302_09032 [Kwoniella bestiolae CBS 10118]OCF21356.1 hypothetical protein I302_09032 [Kwoniella bestiolae CBS 10118]